MCGFNGTHRLADAEVISLSGIGVTYGDVLTDDASKLPSDSPLLDYQNSVDRNSENERKTPNLTLKVLTHTEQTSRSELPHAASLQQKERSTAEISVSNRKQKAEILKPTVSGVESDTNSASESDSVNSAQSQGVESLGIDSQGTGSLARVAAGNLDASLAPFGSSMAAQRVGVKFGPKPPYPVAARRAGFEGAVVLRVLVDKSGEPKLAEVRKSSGRSDCDESAQRTVQNKWQFDPVALFSARQTSGVGRSIDRIVDGMIERFIVVQYSLNG